jgi:hypothetical protein
MKRALGKSMTINCSKNDELYFISRVSKDEGIQIKTKIDQLDITEDSTFFEIMNISKSDEGDYYCLSNPFYIYSLHVRSHHRKT